MTARELWEFALIEVNKLGAPTLILEDYNYLLNKAVQQYINKVYNRYDINQQSTDDLRVLKTSAVLPLYKMEQANPSLVNAPMYANVYVAQLPQDYLHLLNCIVEYQLESNFKCYTKDSSWQQGATRLTSDLYPAIIHNAYMRPSYKRPYYFINNTNMLVDRITEESKSPFAAYKGTVSTNQNGLFQDSEITNATDQSKLSQRTKNTRTSNVSQVLLEIRYGKDDVFKASQVYVDYIKSPMFIRLTQEQIEDTLDTSQVLEFPDYVCYEIVNELVKLLLENSGDPRLQSNFAVNQTIAGPNEEASNSKSKN